jgi:hypothetical protein
MFLFSTETTAGPTPSVPTTRTLAEPPTLGPLLSHLHAPRPIFSPTRAQHRQRPPRRFPRLLRGRAVMRASGRR